MDDYTTLIEKSFIKHAIEEIWKYVLLSLAIITTAEYISIEKSSGLIIIVYTFIFALELYVVNLLLKELYIKLIK